MNATHFFQRSGEARCLPACSESFWSTVFAFFLLHLAREGEGERTLRVWQTIAKPAGEKLGPWYEPKRSGLRFDPRGLTLGDVAVEPTTVANIWPEIGNTLTGIAPDLVLRFVLPSGYRYVFVETKAKDGACLGHNQVDTYPNLITRLGRDGVDIHLFVLKSIGCSSKLHDQTARLQQILGARFGLLLWEDVFLTMQRCDFSLPGLDVTTLQTYTDARRDCDSWEVT